MGNLASVAKGLERVGARVTMTADPAAVRRAGAVVLPGVGAFRDASDRLEGSGLADALLARIQEGVPFLGVCLGLQLLFDGSEEDDAGGLGLIPGMVRALRDTPRLPHIGWNDIAMARPDPLFSGIEPGTTFYFVHSFAPVADDPGDVIATSEYGHPFVAAARRGRVAGLQFHPERSGAAGLRILANFVTEAGSAAHAA